MQGHGLIEKLDPMALTGIAADLYGDFTHPQGVTPEPQQQHQDQQQVESGI
jgi:hypothetical protein